jgi:hypothetical protein
LLAVAMMVVLTPGSQANQESAAAVLVVRLQAASPVQVGEGVAMA